VGARTLSRISQVLAPMVAARLADHDVTREALYRDMRVNHALMSAALTAAAAEEALDQVGSQLAIAALSCDEAGREQYRRQRDGVAALLAEAREQVCGLLAVMGQERRS
jgi:hypothetical protein